MKDKSDNSRGRRKEWTKAYKSYADYAFPNNETRHPYCENAVDSVPCTLTNDECQLPNWEYVLRKCNACTSIALRGVEIYPSNRAPMITFYTYMTQFNCSHHGILICEKITTYLDAGKSKKTCFLMWTINPNKESWFHTQNTVWESKNVFHSTQDWWFPQRLLY